MIVFSAKISSKHQERLRTSFPRQTFIFCHSAKEAFENVKDAVVYVTFGDDVDEKLLSEAKKLKWIAVLSAGVDGFPFSLLKEKGITVTNAKGIHAIQMSEYAISMLLQVYRQAKVITKNEENHIWDKSIRMQEISGKTMLVAGTGAIGSEVARLAKAFRMKTIGVSRSGNTVEYFDENDKIENLDSYLPSTDFIVSVLPSTEETKDVFTLEQFKLMPENAVFLNMGRGDAVIEADLLTAVQTGEIAHAVLDVFHEEPLPENHPFWGEENITVTPHVSGLSPNYMKRALEILAKNIEKYETNEKNFVNRIDLDRGY
ncbi:D-2-hydroxyacid dehydrogenase [Oceanobacillus bengalensis]|uniref:D-2-hydroxyacid dehydrogenase n=1 Tax=Oceanobacillus bengalensis TaxID=1435466 RepID=A0A494YW22_9BACI|nr:D-2-hydroxyacid dehydrogenase [Oceanobacillus bengalensis]RKQ14351.1 D-2-hydroxyacid dehydrogenase [Oceanobacillus bengalensis]